MRSPATEGAETELYRSQDAQVYLVDVEANVLMQTGDFVFSFANHARAPLAALMAMVGDLQWPVGKDSLAMRVGDKCFIYALHGLIYRLVLGEFTTAADTKKVEGILQEYATFEVLSEIITEVERREEKPVAADAQADYWTRVAASLENMSARTANRGGFWGSSRPIASGALSGVERGEGGVFSPRLRRRIQQMRRVSAVAKLFTKALVKGMINPSSHVEVGDGGSGGGGAQGSAEVAVASVDAVTQVVEAVEMAAGRGVLDAAVSEWVRRRCADQPAAAEGFDAGGRIRSSSAAWTLSKLGLRMLYGASTTLINSGSFSRSSSDTSATSSTGASRLLSSSSSASNSASPPPFPSPPAAPSNASPPPLLPPPAATIFRQPPLPSHPTTSLHRPTPARPASTLAAARRPPPFLLLPPRPPGDASDP